MNAGESISPGALEEGRDAAVPWPAPPLDAAAERRVRRRARLLAAVFVGLTAFNFLYPSPSGPADNGDFDRIFATFSSGPVGHEFWPPSEDHDAYRQRFHNYYHRFWRRDRGKPEFVHRSTSRLFFLPGRLLSLTPHVFDLAWNALLLALFAGAVLYRGLVAVGRSAAAWSLAAFALVCADANVSGYLNSFFQESGALLAFLAVVCAAHALWARRTVRDVALLVGACVVLAGTKLAYTPSVLPAVLPVLVGVAVADARGGRVRRSAGAAVALLLLASVLLAQWLAPTPGNERRVNCYDFLFGAAVPALAPADGHAFLRSLGLDPALARLRGKNVYAPDSELDSEPLRSRLGTPLHRAAALELARRHPAAFLALVRMALANVGRYRELRRPALSDPPGVAPRFRWHAWSALHERVLHGAPFYGVVVALLVATAALAWRTRAAGWPSFALLCAAGFVPASVLQAVIAIVGDGPPDLVKHLYFANLLLDAAFVLLACALVALALRVARDAARRRASAGAPSVA